MSDPETEPTGASAGDVANPAAAIETHASPPARVPPQRRFDPNAELLANIPAASPSPLWIESSRAKIVDGRPVSVHPGPADSIYVDIADAPIGLIHRQAEAPQPVHAHNEPSLPAAAARRGFFHGRVRQAAAVAVALGLCGAAGSLARLGHDDTPDPAVAAAAEKARAAEASEAEAKRQIAQISIDMRLMSAKVETLRAEIERGRYADDSRGLKRSVDALRAGLESSKSETATTLGQMAQKLDRMQRTGSSERLAQIAERLDRIERRGVVSNDVTGSIARPSTTPAPLPVPKPVAIAHASSHQGDSATPSTTRVAATSLPGPRSISPDKESETKPDSKPQPKVISGLVLRDIEGNVAIVEGRGGVFGISRGDFIPGVGRVEGIERRGRESVVITSRGVITTHAQR